MSRADSRVTMRGGLEGVTQNLIGLRIACNQPAGGRAQDVAGGKNSASSETYSRRTTAPPPSRRRRGFRGRRPIRSRTIPRRRRRCWRSGEWSKGRRGHSVCLFVGEAPSFAARGEFRTDLRRFVHQLLEGGLVAIRSILGGWYGQFLTSTPAVCCASRGRECSRVVGNVGQLGKAGVTPKTLGECVTRRYRSLPNLKCRDKLFRCLSLNGRDEYEATTEIGSYLTFDAASRPG